MLKIGFTVPLPIFSHSFILSGDLRYPTSGNTLAYIAHLKILK